VSQGNHSSFFVTLTSDEQTILDHWKRSTTISQARNRRARIILLLAERMPIARIARTVGISRRHCYIWIRRFQAARVAGLYGRREGVPRALAQKEPVSHPPTCRDIA
jgi:transposase